MLQEGIPIPTHNPSPSPILLVKKKDGSWQFCVNYRALNVVTVKDKFPIPNVDELLYELRSTKVSTKIDLRTGAQTLTKQLSEHVMGITTSSSCLLGLLILYTPSSQ